MAIRVGADGSNSRSEALDDLTDPISAWRRPRWIVDGRDCRRTKGRRDEQIRVIWSCGGFGST